jgi:hypothetical protein
MHGFAAWLASTAASRIVVQYPWIWPVCEILHFIGLSLVLGIAGFFDLRLMGFMNRVPVAAARDLMPFAIAGFLTNLATGATFFVGKPDQYIDNLAWWAKVFCLFLAGANAMFFETTVGTRALVVGAGEDTPRAAKIVGAVSLASWLGVLYFGRMLPYIGGAF